MCATCWRMRWSNTMDSAKFNSMAAHYLQVFVVDRKASTPQSTFQRHFFVRETTLEDKTARYVRYFAFCLQICFSALYFAKISALFLICALLPTLLQACRRALLSPFVGNLLGPDYVGLLSNSDICRTRRCFYFLPKSFFSSAFTSLSIVLIVFLIRTLLPVLLLYGPALLYAKSWK